MLSLDIKGIRKSNIITQEKLSNLTGLSQSYISSLESSCEKVNPTINTISEIAKALDVCPLDIISCNCEKCKGSK